MKTSDNRSWLADLGLLSVGLIWGSNFLITKNAMSLITPLWYLGIRFIIAGVLMWLIFHKRMRSMRKNEFKAGIIIGVFLFGGFALQTIGLLYVSPGKSGFIAGMTVIIVPFLYWAVAKKKPDGTSLVGATMALVGFAVMSLQLDTGIAFGDIITFASTVMFSAHLVAIAVYAPQSDPLVISVIQLLFTGMLSMFSAFIFEPAPAQAIPLGAWAAILYGAVFASIYAFGMQNVAQRHTAPSHAALALSTESVFALVFSVAFGFELLTLRMFVGAVLILAGVLTVELKPRFL